MKNPERSNYSRFISIFALGIMLVVVATAQGGTGKFDSATGKFDFIISIRFNATDAQIEMIKERFTEASAVLEDATDGQHRFGKITICNNSRAGDAADYWILEGSGRSNAPLAKYGTSGFHARVYFSRIEDTGTGHYTIAHEHCHLAYGVRDEYIGSGGTAICVVDPPNPASLTACLMDNFKTRGGASSGTPTLNEFCVASNHDPDGDTRQDETHMESCWETIESSSFPATAPMGLPTDAPPTAIPPTYPMVDPEGRFVMIIDRSGSMSTDNRIDLAKIGGKQFVDLAKDGDKLGVVSFSNTAGTNFPLTIVDAAARTSARGAIDGLIAAGSTAMGAGLQQAESILPSTQRACLESFILLSDGFHNTGVDPLSVLPGLVAKGIIVHTIGVGNNVDASLLNSLATQSGGRFFSTTSAAGIVSIFTQLSTITQEGGIFAQEPGEVATGETREIIAHVDAQTNRASFVLNWDGPAFDLDLSLRNPDGAIITSADAATDPNITFSADAGFELFIIDSPSSGNWDFIVDGVSANKNINGVSFEVIGLSDARSTNLLVTTNKNELIFPEPILVMAQVIALDARITGLDVNGSVIRPDGSTVSITLFDDGLSSHGDEEANDGIFSNLFSNYNFDGTYNFRIEAVNTAGTIVPGEEIDGPPDPRIPDPFTRVSNTAVIVTNVDVMPLAHEFVFLADKNVSFKGIAASEGDIHSNDYIRFRHGAGSTHSGNLTAVDDIEIRESNTVTGDATAGDMVENSGTISGIVSENAVVDSVFLPELSFTASGEDIIVAPSETLSLPPGSYGNVQVKFGGTLSFSSGDYFIDELEFQRASTLTLDITDGPVEINTLSELNFKDNSKVEILPSGEAGTADVTFNSLQTEDLRVGPGAIVLGTIIAPEAEVEFKDGSRFKGAVCAKKIAVQDDVTILHHSSAMPLPAAVVLELEAGDNFLAAIAETYELQQNYPNPFNPATTIRFALPEPGEITLKIYDPSGRLVKTLVSSYMGAGYHNVIWNSTNDTGNRVASGLYFYELKSGNFRQVRKMLLLK